jgi:hypothetical protein
MSYDFNGYAETGVIDTDGDIDAKVTDTNLDGYADMVFPTGDAGAGLQEATVSGDAWIEQPDADPLQMDRRHPLSSTFTQPVTTQREAAPGGGTHGSRRPEGVG